MKPEKSLTLKQIATDLNPNLMKIHDYEHIPDYTWVTRKDEYPGEPEYDPQSKMDKASLRVFAYDRNGNRLELSTLRPLEFHVRFDNDFNCLNHFDFNGPEIENLIRENQE